LGGKHNHANRFVPVLVDRRRPNLRSRLSGQFDGHQRGIDSTDALGDENTFLTLLVAQIQNQDPTQPIDSTTFLTQLASFSQLEQLIGIRSDVAELDPATTGTSATSTGTTASSTQSS
jgi:flagellar basal-body rod modification protein FlgD